MEVIFKVLEVTNQLYKFVIIEFPSLKDREKCWSSKDYKSIYSDKQNGSEIIDLELVETRDSMK